jgi:hypothetical protein
MYEWYISESEKEVPNRFKNGTKLKAYAYWESVRNMEFNSLMMDDLLFIHKIVDLHTKELKQKTYKR